MTLLKASRFPSDPGRSGWYELLPPPAAAVVLESDIKADVAIVGGGFAGLSAARRLVQLDPAVRVVVLEAGRFAEGPAGRNSGFMIDLPHDLSSDTYAGPAAAADSAQTRMNRHAIRFAGEAAAEYDMGSGAYDPCGKVNGAASEAGDRHNRDYQHHLAALGEACEWLDETDMRKMTGISYYRSGLYTPGTVLLQPAAYIRQLAKGLARSSRSVQLFESSAVLSIANQSGHWVLKTAKGSVAADKVIMATNGHAESFGLYSRKLLHVITYASMTHPIKAQHLGGQSAWGLTPADPMGTTVRRIQTEAGARIIVRSRFTYNPSMQANDQKMSRIGQLHEQKFLGRFPGLASVGMAYRWGGHLCLSWNGVPAHGEIKKGLFSAVCQNGLGTAKGTLAGMSAAELVYGHRSDISQYMTSMPEPRTLPTQPLTTMGMEATLRWKEWRAGRE